MHKEIIARAAAYVKEKFENEYSGHDWFHTLRVWRLAARIADLKDRGHNITSEIVHGANRYGEPTRYSVYRLTEDKEL